MAKQVFYSFHYLPDCWRAATVRNIGVVEGNRLATDNDWETIISRGDQAIKNWIQEQMKYRSCTVVLIGSNTANRKWINYEIIESWNAGMGVVGINIHGLLNRDQEISQLGNSPFDYISLGTSKTLSSVVKRYNPAGNNSKERYDWISKYIANAVAEAVAIRAEN